jgi:hypothetical protein
MANPFHLPQFLPCRFATTGNVSLTTGSTPLAPDGISVSANDRIAVWQQTVGSANGFYKVVDPGTGSDGTWVRTDDLPMGANNLFFPGSSVYIAEGTANAQTRLTITNTGVITIGTTSITFTQEALLMRTDATSTSIFTVGPFSTAIIWSDAVNMRDFKEISVWFQPITLGSNTQVDLSIQWSDDGSTIPFDDDNGIQQTDFLITNGTDGTFKPKNYVATLTTASGELVADKMILLTFPKKGGSFRFGVKGNHASGTFSGRSLRIS